MKVRIESTGEIFERGICQLCGMPEGTNEFCEECEEYQENEKVEKELNKYIEENEKEAR